MLNPIGLCTVTFMEEPGGEVIARFKANWNKGLERFYLLAHRRLPGSQRTARLRKKRDTRMNDWLDKYHREQRRQWFQKLQRSPLLMPMIQRDLREAQFCYIDETNQWRLQPKN